MIETDSERLAKAICHSRGYDPDVKASEYARSMDTPRGHVTFLIGRPEPLWRFYLPEAKDIIASLASDIDKDDEPELPLELPAEPESEEPHWSERMGLYETGNA